MIGQSAMAGALSGDVRLRVDCFLVGISALRCGRPAEKLIKYQLEDITRILKYCNNCFELSVIEDKGKDKKVKLLDTGQRNETIAVVDKKSTSRAQ